MALINLKNPIKAQQGAQLGSYEELESRFKQNESTLFNGNTARGLIKASAGLESDEGTLQLLDNEFATVKSTVAQIFQDQDFSEAGLESAARTAMLLGDTGAILSSLREADVELAAGLESFSKEKLGQFRAATVEVNALSGDATGLLQDLYPVIEVGANYGGVTINLQRFCKIGNVVNDGEGAPISWERKHIVEAYRQAGMLNSNTNELFPIVVTGANESYFPDPALIPTMKIAGTELHTAPLKASEDKINLLGLSRVQNPYGEMNKHTFNDRINEGARLGSLFFALGTTAPKAFELKLDLYNTAQFIRGANVGRRNETTASLDVTDLTVDLTTTQAGEVAELKALADLGYVRVTFSQIINAKLNLHDGNFTQTFGTPKVSGLYKANDNVNYVGDTALADKITAIAPAYVAFTVKASLSSKTLRLRGDRVDEEVIPFTYLMSARAPITAERAITETEVNDIVGVMGATEVIRRETQAVEHMIAKVAELHEMFKDSSVDVQPHGLNMAGMCYISRPWVQIETINVKDLVDSIESRNRRENIANALVHLLGDRALRAITETNYLESKRIYTKNASAKAEFTLLSSRNIGRYLYTEGDDRTFGALDGEMGTKPKVITSSLDIMDDKIIMFLRGDGGNENLDVFGWGNCLRGTTLVYDVEISEGDSTKRHLQLQPFYEFIVNMPIAYELNVTGLGEYLKSKAAVLVDNTMGA